MQLAPPLEQRIDWFRYRQVWLGTLHLCRLRLPALEPGQKCSYRPLSLGVSCSQQLGPGGCHVHTCTSRMRRHDRLLRLSGPVLRATARLSQRCPHIPHYGLGCLNMRLCDTPPHYICELEARYPVQKGYPSDTRAIPHDTISKRYCSIWGGISHWAAEYWGCPSGWLAECTGMTHPVGSRYFCHGYSGPSPESRRCQGHALHSRRASQYRMATPWPHWCIDVQCRQSLDEPPKSHGLLQALAAANRCPPAASGAGRWGAALSSKCRQMAGGALTLPYLLCRGQARHATAATVHFLTVLQMQLYV